MLRTSARLKEEQYSNWLTVSRAIDVFHSLLLRFVRFHARRIWHEVSTTWIKSQALCDTCNSCDVTFNARRVPKSRCWSVPCARGVCSRWVAEVARIHAQAASGQIAFSNSRVQEWPLDSWEFAKVFMTKIPQTTHLTHNPPQTIHTFDCDDVISTEHLLSFIVNCSHLHASVRRSTQQEGGVGARHIIKLKKVLKSS